MVLRATINYLVVLLKIKNVGPILSTWFLVEIRLTCLVVPLRCCQLAFELGVTFSLVPILPGLLWWGMSTSVYDPFGARSMVHQQNGSHSYFGSSPLSSKICSSNKLNELKYKDQHLELISLQLKYPRWDIFIFIAFNNYFNDIMMPFRFWKDCFRGLVTPSTFFETMWTFNSWLVITWEAS